MTDLNTAHLRRPVLKRRLRLGFVGGGRGGLVGEWHAAGARLSNQWEIVAGALSSDPANAERSAQDWVIPAERSYGDWQEMAQAEGARADGIEAVVVCTPNFTHHEICAGFIIISRGQGAGVYPAAERLSHLPRAHSEALTDAWANLYSEMALSIAARRHGYALPKDLVELWSVDDGARGVRFVELCADSHEAGGMWTAFEV